MPQLTVIIPCKDECHNIADCVAAVRPVADEIIVADSGSQDGTLDIVRNLGDCRLIQREYVNCADFKNWAIPQASHPWVLICDADERPTPALVAEVRSLLRETPPHDGYEIQFQTYFLGYPVQYSGLNTFTSLRLFRRDLGRYAKMQVHADVEIATGNVGRLRSRFEHFTCQCLNRYTQTQNRYSTWRALDMHALGRRVTFWGVCIRPLLRFLQFYFLRRGFLDGRAGLMICSYTAFYTFLKYAKLWELEHSRTKAAIQQPLASDHATNDVAEYQRQSRQVA